MVNRWATAVNSGNPFHRTTKCEDMIKCLENVIESRPTFTMIYSSLLRLKRRILIAICTLTTRVSIITKTIKIITFEESTIVNKRKFWNFNSCRLNQWCFIESMSLERYRATARVIDALPLRSNRKLWRLTLQLVWPEIVDWIGIRASWTKE